MQWKKCFKSSSFNDLSLIDVFKSSNFIKDECKREMTRQTNGIFPKREEVYRLYDEGLSFGNMA